VSFGTKPDSGNQTPELGQGDSDIPMLADWVHGCADDAATRTALITTFVLCFCQAAGPRLTGHMPSLILVRPDVPQAQALDKFAQQFATWCNVSPEEYRKQTKGPYFDESSFCKEKVENQLELYLQMIIKQNARVSWRSDVQRNDLEKEIRALKNELFGTGLSRPYANAHHRKFGMVAGRGDQLILRLDTFEDQLAFRNDVRSMSPKLFCPSWLMDNGQINLKHIAISGAVAPEQWEQLFAQNALGLPFPVLFLPQPQAADNFRLPPDQFVNTLMGISRMMPRKPVPEPYSIAAMPWFCEYAERMRLRLRHLPIDYDHGMQRLMRQIPGACLRYVEFLDIRETASLQMVDSLAFDLFTHATRGLAISVAGLAWHCLGFDPGCPLPEARRVLEYLRTHGPMTSSDLLRKAHLKKAERDDLVKRLAEQDLVRIDGKIIRPTSYQDFVEALYVRPEFPVVGKRWDTWAKPEKPAVGAGGGRQKTGRARKTSPKAGRAAV